MNMIFYISEKADRGKCPYVADELKPQEEKFQGEVIQATEQGKKMHCTFQGLIMMFFSPQFSIF